MSRRAPHALRIPSEPGRNFKRNLVLILMRAYCRPNSESWKRTLLKPHTTESPTTNVVTDSARRRVPPSSTGWNAVNVIHWHRLWGIGAKNQTFMTRESYSRKERRPNIRVISPIEYSTVLSRLLYCRPRDLTLGICRESIPSIQPHALALN